MIFSPCIRTPSLISPTEWSPITTIRSNQITSPSLVLPCITHIMIICHNIHQYPPIATPSLWVCLKIGCPQNFMITSFSLNNLSFLGYSPFSSIAFWKVYPVYPPISRHQLQALTLIDDGIDPQLPRQCHGGDPRGDVGRVEGEGMQNHVAVPWSVALWTAGGWNM